LLQAGNFLDSHTQAKFGASINNVRGLSCPLFSNQEIDLGLIQIGAKVRTQIRQLLAILE
jgi:hypothetical protein